MTCGPCQDLLLDYLYGLCDPAETENLRSHLDDCPQCRAALERATLEKTRIAKAARAISDVPEFRAPDHRPSDPTPLPAPLANVPPPRRSGYRPLAWVIASALATCVLVVGFFGYRLNERIGDQSAVLAQLNRKIESFNGAVAAHDAATARKRQELPQTLGREVVQLTVAGANRVVPGVTAPLTVSLADLDGLPHRGDVECEVLDAQNKTIVSRHLAVDRSATVSAAELAGNHVGPAKVVVRYAAADGKPAVIEEQLRLMPKSYAAHLALNKQLFRPGEAVLVRALFVDPWTLKVADGPLQASVSLTDETGVKVTQPLAFVKGMAAAGMHLPPNLPPGVYTVRLNAEELAPTSRTIEVLGPDQPTADVAAQGRPYHGGDMARVPVQVFQRDGTPAANSPVVGNYRVQNSLEQRNFNYGNNAQFQNRGQGVGGFNGFNGINNGINNAGNNTPNSTLNNTYTGSINEKTDANGQIFLPVQVPKELETKNLRLDLDMQIKKQKVEASASLRVMPSKLAVDFHPEGGRLVAGVANRVYYRVHTPLGETVAPEGRVILMSSTAVIHDSEREQSVGVFDFVPDPKEKYQLRITAPMQGQVDDPFAGLGIRPDGVLLLGDGVQPGDRPIRLDVENVGRSRLLQVITTCRGEIVEYQHFRQEEGVFSGPAAIREIDKHEDKVRAVAAERPEPPARKDVGGRRIEIASKLDGIHRVAVFEVGSGAMTLLAERLIYRQPAHRLDVSAKLSSKTGNHVQFRVAGKDEAERPTEFFGLASVVDDRFVDSQPEPSLTEQFLVLGDPTAEVVDQPLLVNPAGLDLALGVLGWQAGPTPEPAQVARADAANKRDETKLRAEGQLDRKAGRNRAADAPDAKRASDASTTFFSRVEPNPEALRQRLAALAATARADLDQRASKERQALLDEQAALIQQRTIALAELRGLEEQPHEWAMMGLGAVTLGSLVLGTLALLWGFARMLRGGSASASFGVAFAGIAGCLLLLLFRPPQDIAKAERLAELAPQPAPHAAPLEDPGQANAMRPDAAPMPAMANDSRVAVGVLPVAEGLGDALVAPLPAAGAGGGGLGALGGRQIAEQEGYRRMAPGMRGAQSALMSKKASVQLKMEKDAEAQPKELPGLMPGGFGAAGPAPPGPPPSGLLPPPGQPQKDAAKGNAAEPKKPAQAPATAKSISGPATAPAAAAPTPGAAPVRDNDEFAKLLERADASARVDAERARAEFGMKRSIDVATLLWNPAIYVPAGGATLSFDVPGDAARYRILLLGHTSDGRLGSFEDRLVVTPASPRRAP